MNKPWRGIAPILASLILSLGAAVWAVPTTAATAMTHLSVTTEQAPLTETISGKIASINSDSFTLAVAPNTGKTMLFKVDPNTVVEGAVKVGVNADVTYRQEKGQDIAVRIKVTSDTV